MRGVVGVEAQADDVHRLAGEGDRDLGAGEVLHAVRARGRGGAVLAADLVVVGQRPQFDAVGGGARGQLFGRQGAVGHHGVAMQVGVQLRVHARIVAASHQAAAASRVGTGVQFNEPLRFAPPETLATREMRKPFRPLAELSAGKAAGRRAVRSAVGTFACGEVPWLLGLVARRKTRCARCARYAQTHAAGQITKRAARAATGPALLGADHWLPSPPARSLAGNRVPHSRSARGTVSSRPEGGVPTGRIGAGEQRSAERGSPAYPPGRREAVKVGAASSGAPRRHRSRPPL